MDKVKLVVLMVKGVTGILGASLVLSEDHPYWALFVLSLGAIVNEYLIYIKK